MNTSKKILTFYYCIAMLTTDHKIMLFRNNKLVFNTCNQQIINLPTIDVVWYIVFLNQI